MGGRWFSAFVDLVIGKFCLAAAVLSLLAALAAVAVQIFARYVLNDSLVWAEEFARYAIIWSTFVGCAVAYRLGEHMNVTVLEDSLPEGIGRWVARLVHLVSLAFAGLVAWEGWFLTLRIFERGELSTGLQVGIAWFYLAVPVGAALIAIAALESFLAGRRIAASRPVG